MSLPRILTSLLLLLAPFSSVLAADLDPAGVDFFEQKIRPVLVTHCYKCHAADAKPVKGGLMLDSRDALLKGGDTGPALIPGKVEESPLIAALRYGEDSYKMPPAGKLPATVIADFEKWVAMGAPDPRESNVAASARPAIDLVEGRKFWSFQPPRLSPLPPVAQKDWIREPIDVYVLAKLEAAGRAPSREADRRTLLRRVYFDLIGLPPTPAETAEFLSDESPDAFARVVDRLLNSPHYGERWGRHWLDVVRYAEDNTNMGPHNGPYDYAYRYRDWVVQALNDDVPYDEFIKRQLATDLMPGSSVEDLPALGFMGLGPSNHKEVALAKIELDKRFADDWEDRVDTLGRGLLGLTLACARCHDHKYDPIASSDYYAIAGVFASCRQTTRPLISQEQIDAGEPARKQVAELENEIKTFAARIKAADAAEKAAADAKAKAAAQATAPTEQSSAATKESPPATPTAAELRAQEAALQTRIEEIKRATPNFEVPLANALTEETILVEEINAEKMTLVFKPEPRDLPLYIRGDIAKPGPIVPRRFVSVLSPEQPQPFAHGSGRLDLAEAIASPDNPLTARVIVNRVWRQHFGAGLVTTPSNFGRVGDAPTHPELLDYLAVTFMSDGWSLKRLHRRLVLSATYRQASRVTPETISADPENRLLGRYRRRRLEIEPYRDAILAICGNLDRTLGGPSLDLDSAEHDRRTLYAKVSRHKLDDTLAAFDFPDPNIHAERRAVTTTPLQQLFVLNSGFMQQEANLLTQRVASEAGALPAQRVRFLYELLFAREPTADEERLGAEFLAGEEPAGQPARLGRYVQALLDSNELLYVD